MNPDSKVHGTNMGPTWVLSAPDGPHVGPMKLAIREVPLFHQPQIKKLDALKHESLFMAWSFGNALLMHWRYHSHGLSHWIYDYHKTSNISCTKIPNLKWFPSCCTCLCPIHWSHVLSREWRCSWSSADRRCSNYIWVVNKSIPYQSAAYIRDLIVW